VVRGKAILKPVHVFSTAWFVLCLGYVLITALRQAGFDWWVIFSLSGYSLLVIFLLISVYLFVIFRGASDNKEIVLEHPLTSTNYYMAFYTAAPFIGALGGILGMAGEANISDFLLGVCFGTLGATFLAWIIVDLSAALFEMLLPVSRIYRAKRQAKSRILKQQQQMAKEFLLTELESYERQKKFLWDKTLTSYAERLIALMLNDSVPETDKQAEAIEIAVNSWRIGGLDCMRYLHDMAVELYEKKCPDLAMVDHISVWWDGVGSWRSRWFEEQTGCV